MKICSVPSSSLLFIWAAPYSLAPLQLMPTGLLLLSSVSVWSFLPFRCTTGSVHKDLQGSGKRWAGFGEGRYHHGYAVQQWWWVEWTMPVLNCWIERTKGFFIFFRTLYLEAERGSFPLLLGSFWRGLFLGNNEKNTWLLPHVVLFPTPQGGWKE